MTAVTEIAGAAVANTQGNTIRELKASRATWRKRAYDWEHELALAKVVIDDLRDMNLELDEALEAAREQANKARRERDEYYQELVGCQTDHRPITEPDPYGPDKGESDESI